MIQKLACDICEKKKTKTKNVNQTSVTSCTLWNIKSSSCLIQFFGTFKSLKKMKMKWNEDTLPQLSVLLTTTQGDEWNQTEIHKEQHQLFILFTKSLFGWMSTIHQKWRKKIDFLKGKRVCFRYLNTGHLRKNCEKHKQSHPTVLHIHVKKKLLLHTLQWTWTDCKQHTCVVSSLWKTNKRH